MSEADAIAHQKRHGFLTDTMRTVEPPQTALPKLRGSRQPNKTESEFGRILEARKQHGEFISVTFEGVKLRIAGNCYYTPDWVAANWLEGPGIPEAYITFFEVKGAHIWDDSKVKFKAAKELHPWADFEMWQKKKGEWARVL